MVKKTTTTKKRSTTAKKTTARRTAVARAPRSQKVDYYPNRMGLAVAALAVISLLLFGMLSAFN